MGILVQKKQQGGSIYADPRYIVLNADIPMQTPYGSGARPQAMAKPTSVAAGKNADNDLEGALPSDIAYYGKRKAAITEQLKEVSNTENPAKYNELTQQLYDLDNIELPKMKAMYNLYKASFDKFKADDTPVVIGNSAIVGIKDANGNTVDYKSVSTDELLKNHGKYRLIYGSELATLRHSDERFSGFTELGRFANQFLDDAYGSEAFVSKIDEAIKNAGFIQTAGKYKQNISDAILNPQDYDFDATKGLATTNKTKTNVPQLIEVYNSMQNSGNTNMTNYMNARAVENLYQKMNEGIIKLDENTDLKALQMQSVNFQILSNLKRGVNISTEEERKKRAATGGGSEGKDIETHVINIANAKLMDDEKAFIEVPGKISKENYLFEVNKANVDSGYDLLESGYDEKLTVNDDDDRKGIKKERRTLDQNSVLRSMNGGTGEISFYNGESVKEKTMNGSLNQAVLANGTNLTLLLAPIEKNKQGKYVVNFNSPYISAVKEATKEAYKQAHAEGITYDMIAMQDKGAMNRLSEIATEIFRKKIGKNAGDAPKIGVAFAFDILYNSNDDVRDLIDASGQRVKDDDPNYIYIEDMIDDVNDWSWDDKNFKLAKAFIPASESFWANSFSKTYTDEKFRRKYTPTTYEGALTEKPMSNNAVNIGGNIPPESKKFGGKLMSSNELAQLLFNYK